MYETNDERKERQIPILDLSLYITAAFYPPLLADSPDAIGPGVRPVVFVVPNLPEPHHDKNARRVLEPCQELDKLISRLAFKTIVIAGVGTFDCDLCRLFFLLYFAPELLCFWQRLSPPC